MERLRVPAVLGHYRISREIGRGGMGAVFEAWDRRDGSRVAVKILDPALAEQDPTFRERFEREAHVAALLRSPYTVHLLDYGLEAGLAYLAVEFVEGQSVAELIANGPLPMPRAVRIGTHVARALEEAEARGVIHRDIKPANVLIGPGESVKVADFGIARGRADGRLTAPGGFVGTAAFAAPEQFEGQADHRSDVYGVGATLYAMLTGRPPSPGRDGVLDLSALGSFPNQLANVVRRCLEPDPRDRYQGATELAGALSRSAQASSGAPPPATTPAVAPIQHAAPPPSPPMQRAAPPLPAPQAFAAPPAPVAATRGVTMRLEARGHEGNDHQFALVIHNGGGTPLNLRLAAYDDSGRLYVDLPESTSVAPGGAVSVVVRVAPRGRRVFGGAQQCAFRIEALPREGGPPAATVGGAIFETPDPRGRMLLFALAGIGAVVLIIGVLAASEAFGGGVGGQGIVDDTEEPSSPTRTRTSTPEETVTEAVDGATPTPTTGAEPANSIAVGEWTYLFAVASNGCGAQPAIGTEFTFTYRFDEVGETQDGFITVGEVIRVTHIGGTYVANLTFAYPEFGYGYDLDNGGRVVVVNRFDTAHHGIANYTEIYPYGSSTCSIYAEDKG